MKFIVAIAQFEVLSVPSLPADVIPCLVKMRKKLKNIDVDYCRLLLGSLSFYLSCHKSLKTHPQDR